MSQAFDQYIEGFCRHLGPNGWCAAPARVLRGSPFLCAEHSAPAPAPKLVSKPDNSALAKVQARVEARAESLRNQKLLRFWSARRDEAVREIKRLRALLGVT